MKPITAALMIAVFAMTTAAVAGTPAAASATKSHHARRPPPFSMPNCLKAAERFYGPAEARAACADLRAGV